jgi:hypothetical protein
MEQDKEGFYFWGKPIITINGRIVDITVIRHIGVRNIMVSLGFEPPVEPTIKETINLIIDKIKIDILSSNNKNYIKLLKTISNAKSINKK